jgi:hypothetical protein
MKSSTQFLLKKNTFRELLWGAAEMAGRARFAMLLLGMMGFVVVGNTQPCVIPTPTNTICATNILTNSTLENSTTAVFNDNVAGVSASFLGKNDNQATGNTAAPVSYANPFANQPQSQGDYNGIFYLNNNSNKMLWLRNGAFAPDPVDQCVAPVLSGNNWNNFILEGCATYQLKAMVAGWSPSSIVTGSNGTTTLSLEYYPPGGPDFVRTSFTIPTTSDCNSVTWQEVSVTITTPGGSPSAMQVYSLLLSVKDAQRDGLLIDNIQLCKLSDCACTAPTATFTPTASTCTGATQNNNGTIALTTQGNATHYGVSTAGAGTYNGPTTIAGATAIPANGTNIVTGVAHAGASYIVRVFNGASGCFTDITVAVPAGPTCVASCPTIINPSAAQNLCEGATGADITVNTNQNAVNSIRFVRFTSDQMAGTSPTPTEAMAIYGGTAVATVTPTGGASPYTVTLTSAAAGWPALAPGTYYIYAILNPDAGASCRPVQEIVVTIVDRPDVSATNTAICLGSSVNLAGLVTANVPAASPLSYHVTQADADANANALSSGTVAPTVTTTYYVRSSSALSGCFDTAPIAVTVNGQPIFSVSNGSVCIGGSIDLATLVSDGGGNTLTYHTTLANAQAGSNALASSMVSPANASNYYIRSTTAAGCFTVKELTVAITAPACGTIMVTGPN